MRVIKNNILISEPVEKEKKTESGFILPSDRVDFSKPLMSRVIAVGNDVKDIHVDDMIYYLPGAGDCIKKEDMIYRILPDTAVLAIE